MSLCEFMPVLTTGGNAMAGKSKNITLQVLYDMVCELKADFDLLPERIGKIIEILRKPKVCGNCKYWQKVDSTVAYPVGICLNIRNDDKNTEEVSMSREIASCEYFEYKIDEEE